MLDWCAAVAARDGARLEGRAMRQAVSSGGGGWGARVTLAGAVVPKARATGTSRLEPASQRGAVAAAGQQVSPQSAWCTLPETAGVVAMPAGAESAIDCMRAMSPSPEQSDPDAAAGWYAPNAR